MAGRLHELLAVESDIENVYKKVIQEAIHTFGRADHFTGHHKAYKPFDEEAADAELDEYHAVTTTVGDKIDYVVGHVIRFWDAVAQKDATNQNAKADLVVDGKTLVANVPATALLSLERELKQLRIMMEAIPTLPPGVEWIEDDAERKGIFKAKHPEETFRQVKVPEFKVVVEPTDHHPAHVERLEKIDRVGKFTTNKWSGMISSAEKSKRLGRLDKLLSAVKKARARANEQEVVDIHVGKVCMDFILAD